MNIRNPESLLVEHASRFEASRVLCNTLSRGQFASNYLDQFPLAQVTCFFMDLYPCEETQQQLSTYNRLQCVCAADLPDQTFDLVAWSFRRTDEAELSRELIQQGMCKLADDGRLLLATDNPRDKWFHEQLEANFTGFRRYALDHGVVYSALKSAYRGKQRDFSHQLVYRDHQNLIQLRTRPGVFSHRRVDPGARALLSEMEVRSGQRILDLGCGAGTIALAAGLRAPDVSVHAIDSHARAVECTSWGVETNQLSDVSVALDCDGRTIQQETIDMVAANPPYYSDHRISEIMMHLGYWALKADGTLLVVTKDPEWYVDHVSEWYHETTVIAVKKYFVVRCQR